MCCGWLCSTSCVCKQVSHSGRPKFHCNMERLSYHPTHLSFDSGWRILFCVAGMVVATANVVAAATDTLRVRREGRALELEATLPAGVTEVELRIVSTRNRPVPKFSDVSPLAPK